MKPKIPNTPFSTRLSGSAKETELRLRNIFQWKKKRPPVPLFLLTAVLVLSCCGLVSCQTQEEEPPVDTVEVDWNTDNGQTPSADPLETVRSWLEHERTQEHTFQLEIYDIYADEEETQRLTAMYRGRELAQSRGWKDEWFDGRFVVVRAEYYVRYDHTKTFLDDGEVYKHFYLFQNPEDDLWYIVDGAGSYSKGNTTRLSDGELFRLLPVGEEVFVDLNGDGTPETVLVDLVQGEYGASGYTLSINRADHTAALTQFGFFFDSPQDQFAITDLDTGDSLLEIALPDDGPSSDPHTVFLRWDGSALSSLGEVYGKVNDGDLTFDKAGTVSSTMRLSVLQTWFAPVQWQLNSDGVFAPVPQELYTPTYSQPVTALQELAAYADMDWNSQRTSLPVGTQFSFFATDNALWVLCADENGTQFWLHLDEETGHSVELFDGSYSWSALDGLMMAD